MLTLYHSYSQNSGVVATVPLSDGGLNLLRCRNADGETQWCKVRYRKEKTDVSGWCQKDALIPQKRDSVTFEKRFGGRYRDMGKTVMVLDDGFLIGGSTQSFGSGQFDAWLLRIDRFGNLIWQRSFGGSQDDTLEAMIRMGDHIVFTGSTFSLGNHMPSLYVGSVDLDGMREWQRGLFLDEDDRYSGHAIVNINDAHVMIAGYEERIKAFNGQKDAQLNAVSLDGKHKWSRRFGGNKPEHAYSLLRLQDGYLFAGDTDTWGKGLIDAYVVRLDEDGNRLWHRAYGFKYNESARQIIQTREGGFIFVGSSSSFTDRGKEMYIVKMNAKGHTEWQGHYGYRDDEEGFGIIEVEGGYVAVGYTRSIKSHDTQLYLVKLSPQGQVIWERTYGGVNDDIGYAIAKTDDGMIVTGMSKGGTERGEDLYLLKLDKEGRL